MRYAPTLFVLFVVSGLLLTGCETPPPPPPEPPSTTMAQQQAEAARARLEASEGGQVVLRAIEAHGGLETWYDTPTSSYTWEYSNEGSNVRFKSHLVADNQTRHIYHDLLTLGTADDPQPIEAQFAWNGTEAWISPDTLQSPNPRFWATTAYYFQSIPFVLADPGVRYEKMADEDLDGVPHDMVKASYDDGVGDSPGDTYTLYVNKETGLVDAIRYTVTYGRGRPAADAPVRENLFYYLDYTTVDGLTTPTRYQGFRYENGQKGDLRNEAWASNISFREPFDSARLIMPEGGRIQPMPEQ